MRTPGPRSAGRSPVTRTLALLVCVALGTTACGASQTGSAGPRVTLDGERFFHLSGPAPLGRWYESYGHVVDGRLVELAFKSRESRGTRARIFGSVLATLRLR